MKRILRCIALFGTLLSLLFIGACGDSSSSASNSNPTEVSALRMPTSVQPLDAPENNMQFAAASLAKNAARTIAEVNQNEFEPNVYFSIPGIDEINNIDTYACVFSKATGALANGIYPFRVNLTGCPGEESGDYYMQGVVEASRADTTSNQLYTVYGNLFDRDDTDMLRFVAQITISESPSETNRYGVMQIDLAIEDSFGEGSISATSTLALNATSAVLITLSGSNDEFGEEQQLSTVTILFDDSTQENGTIQIDTAITEDANTVTVLETVRFNQNAGTQGAVQLTVDDEGALSTTCYDVATFAETIYDYALFDSTNGTPANPENRTNFSLTTGDTAEWFRFSYETGAGKTIQDGALIVIPASEGANFFDITINDGEMLTGSDGNSYIARHAFIYIEPTVAPDSTICNNLSSADPATVTLPTPVSVDLNAVHPTEAQYTTTSILIDGSFQ